MTTRVRFPITLNVEASALSGDALEQVIAQFRLRMLEVWRQARAELEADGVRGEPEVHIGFDWTGPGRRAFSQTERHAIQRRLHATIDHLIDRGDVIPETTDEWAIETFDFKTTLRLLVRLLWDLPPEGSLQPYVVRYRDQLDDEIFGVAWAVTVLKPVSWKRLRENLQAHRDNLLGSGAIFGWFWNHGHEVGLRQLDGDHLRDLPVLPELSMKVGDLTQVPAGTLILFVGANPPLLDISAVIEFGPTETIEVTLERVFAPSDPLVEWSTVEFVAGLTPGSMAWFYLIKAFGVRTMPVKVIPFAIRKAISPEALAMELKTRADAAQPLTDDVPRAWILGPSNLAALPTEVTEPALRLAAGGTSTPDQVTPGTDWQPGWRGVLTVPQIDLHQLQTRLYYAARDFETELDALTVIKLLGKSGGDLYNALVMWKQQWEGASPEEFDLLLAKLDEKGQLDRFFKSWIEANLYPVTMYPLIKLALQTRYRDRKALTDIIKAIEKWTGGLLLHGYDVDKQVVRLFDSDDADRQIHAAGDSTDPSAGVVAATSSYYSQPAVAKRPSKQTLERMAEPLKRRAGELMIQLACSGEDKTQDEILAAAFKLAAKDAGIDEKRDLEQIEITTSLRVVRLERSADETGVPEIYVWCRDVYRVKGEEWTNSGPLRRLSVLAFEAELKRYHLRHLMQALTIFMLVEAIIFSGVAIIEMGIAAGVASGMTPAAAAKAIIVELILFVVISEVIYVATHWHDLTLTGFLTTILIAELELIGFKGVGKLFGFAGKLTGDFALKVATRVFGEAALARAGTWAVGKLVTKWILFALRAGVVGVEIGTVGVLELLAEDLFRMSQCRGMSSSADYWNRFKWGFVIGAGMELIAVPVLAVALKPIGSKLEAAMALKASGKSYSEITKLLLEGSEAMDAALGRALDNPAITEPLARGFRARMREVLRALGREYETRAYQTLVDLLDRELSRAATRNLGRLVAAGTEKEIDALLASLMRSKTPVGEMLELLGVLDDAALGRLAQSGSMAAVADSPAIMALLRRRADLGWAALERAFGYRPADLDAFLGRFAAQPTTAQLDEALAILTRANNTLAPGLVADAVLRLGTLTPAQVAGLERATQASAIPGALEGFVRTDTVDRVRELLDFFAQQARQSDDYMNAVLRLYAGGRASPEIARAAGKAMANPDIPGLERWLKLAGRERDHVGQILDLEKSLDDAIAQRAVDPATQMEVYAQGGVEGVPPGTRGAVNIDVVTSTARREWKRVNQVVQDRAGVLGQVQEARLKFRDAGLARGAGGKSNVALVDFGAQLDLAVMPEADALAHITRFIGRDALMRQWVDELIVYINGVEYRFPIPI